MMTTTQRAPSMLLLPLMLRMISTALSHSTQQKDYYSYRWRRRIYHHF